MLCMIMHDGMLVLRQNDGFEAGLVGLLKAMGMMQSQSHPASLWDVTTFQSLALKQLLVLHW